MGRRTVLSSKNNIDINHYKTRSRAQHQERIIEDNHKPSFAQVSASPSEEVPNSFRGAERKVRLEGLAVNSRLQRLKRLRKIRGLSARQLMERKISRRATRRHKPDLSCADVGSRVVRLKP